MTAVGGKFLIVNVDEFNVSRPSQEQINNVQILKTMKQMTIKIKTMENENKNIQNRFEDLHKNMVKCQRVNENLDSLNQELTNKLNQYEQRFGDVGPRNFIAYGADDEYEEDVV